MSHFLCHILQTSLLTQQVQVQLTDHVLSVDVLRQEGVNCDKGVREQREERVFFSVGDIKAHP